MRRRLYLGLLLLIGAMGSAVGRNELPRGFGPRFLDVGFEINPFSRYHQMRAGMDPPAEQHR